MAEVGNAVKHRTGATNVLVTTVNSTVYTIELSFSTSSRDRATATLSFTGKSGDFPINVSYVKGASSGSSSFSDLSQVIEYLALTLR